LQLRNCSIRMLFRNNTVCLQFRMLHAAMLLATTAKACNKAAQKGMLFCCSGTAVPEFMNSIPEAATAECSYGTCGARGKKNKNRKNQKKN